MLDRLHTGLLGPHLEQLAETLHQQGYSRASIRDGLYASDKLGHWLSCHGYAIDAITESLLRDGAPPTFYIVVSHRS